LLAAVQLGTIGDLEMIISASSFMVGLLHSLSLCSGNLESHALLVLEGRFRILRRTNNLYRTVGVKHGERAERKTRQC
jgi:hypothetical protein